MADVKIPRDLAHRAACAIESFCNHALTCTSCGANLDTVESKPTHKPECPAVDAARRLRRALEPQQPQQAGSAMYDVPDDVEYWRIPHRAREVLVVFTSAWDRVPTALQYDADYVFVGKDKHPMKDRWGDGSELLKQLSGPPSGGSTRPPP